MVLVRDGRAYSCGKNNDISLSDQTVMVLVKHGQAYSGGKINYISLSDHCVLYTSDAADDFLCVNLSYLRLIKKRLLYLIITTLIVLVRLPTFVRSYYALFCSLNI